MDFIEFQWLYDEESYKDALKAALGSSGQLLKRHFSTKEQSRSIKSQDLARLPLDFVNHMQINPHFRGPRPKILKETQDYLVLHKPAGLHCHPLCYSDQDTLLNFLVEVKYWQPLLINQNHYDRGLLYRLDYETSGVILLAKNALFMDAMRDQFHSLLKRKLYWVVVEGDFQFEGSFTHHFRSSGIKGSKQKVSGESHPLSLPGTLEVKKLLLSEGKSLLLVNLKSGLRHQIRAQLAYMGFPILGDVLYGGRKASRLFLHAWKYEWSEAVEDHEAELFEGFFDLNCALQMSHDVLRSF